MMAQGELSAPCPTCGTGEIVGDVCSYDQGRPLTHADFPRLGEPCARCGSPEHYDGECRPKITWKRVWP